MRRFAAIVLLSALSSLPAVADEIVTGGSKAQILFNALWKAGLGGCGQGNCLVDGSNVSCVQTDQAGAREWECLMNETYLGTELYSEGKEAKNLYSAFMKNSMKPVCEVADGSDDSRCEIAASRAKCARDVESTDFPIYSCVITLP